MSPAPAPPHHEHPPWRELRVRTTAYVVHHDAACQTYTNRTANGTIAHYGTVAADPRVLPFGTRVLVPGYGPGRVEDTGGLIVGDRIDVAVATCQRAMNWGVRVETISYLPPDPQEKPRGSA